METGPDGFTATAAARAWPEVNGMNRTVERPPTKPSLTCRVCGQDFRGIGPKATACPRCRNLAGQGKAAPRTPRRDKPVPVVKPPVVASGGPCVEPECRGLLSVSDVKKKYTRCRSCRKARRWGTKETAA